MGKTCQGPWESHGVSVSRQGFEHKGFQGFFKLGLAFLLVCGVSPRAWGEEAPKPQDFSLSDNRIVGMVVKEAISHEDVLGRLRFMVLSSGRPVTPEIVKTLYNQVLIRLVDEALQRQLIEKYKIKVTEEEVTQQIANMARQNNMKPQDFWTFFRQNNIPRDTFLRRLRTQMGWSRYIQGVYGNQIVVSPKALAHAQEKWRKYHRGTLYRIGEIVLNVRATDKVATVKKQAQDVRDLLSQGAPFMQVAQQFSQAPSRETGGLRPWFSLARLEPELQNLVKTLPLGEITGPFPLPSAKDPKKFVILVVLEAQDAEKLALKEPSEAAFLAELRNTILERCARKEMDNVRKNFYHELRQEKTSEPPQVSEVSGQTPPPQATS